MGLGTGARYLSRYKARIRVERFKLLCVLEKSLRTRAYPAEIREQMYPLAYRLFIS